MTVLVFGSANADLVFRLPALPAPGETVLGPTYEALPGGKGANQAVAAARDGARGVAFAGAVGRDPLAAVATAALRAAGVGLSRLAVVEAAPTGCAAICVDPVGANQIAVAAGANALARAEAVEDAVLGPGTTLLVQMEVPAEETAALVLRARARGARAVLNLAPAGEMPPEALRAVHLLVVNAREAEWLAVRLGGCAAEAAALSAALGGVGVVVTRGAEGAEAATEGVAWHVPAFAAPAPVVDTTGAGDAWCGVLAAALDRGLPLAAAMRRASAAAALACTRPGAAAAMPRAAETNRLMA